ncbi:hypothetical protein Desde_2851 [Desulfitobacterium dehalogenans ATCC 51507]|uniref:Uncharacterized protein n=1 Tax=Desulfitobacterium dehalogenans (strain ATCC 51507 / DSM 9161 / JW/IU-DC1) TaxID=756499 RepID=I4AB19_DESDJ|nr:hypothetical protein Desde_2851 [Desulfitobacterium dehalogenans ATCC 51507]
MLPFPLDTLGLIIYNIFKNLFKLYPLRDGVKTPPELSFMVLLKLRESFPEPRKPAG